MWLAHVIPYSGDGWLMWLVVGMTGGSCDHFDRIFHYRPAMLMGLCGTILSITLFGFSQNFVWAVCTRLMWGLLDGNIGVVKTYMSEVNYSVLYSKNRETFLWCALLFKCNYDPLNVLSIFEIFRFFYLHWLLNSDGSVQVLACTSNFTSLGSALVSSSLGQYI